MNWEECCREYDKIRKMQYAQRWVREQLQEKACSKIVNMKKRKNNITKLVKIEYL